MGTAETLTRYKVLSKMSGEDLKKLSAEEIPPHLNTWPRVFAWLVKRFGLATVSILCLCGITIYGITILYKDSRTAQREIAEQLKNQNEKLVVQLQNQNANLVDVLQANTVALSQNSASTRELAKAVDELRRDNRGR
jgi:hypothetical protein